MRDCPSLLRTFRTRTILNALFAAQNYFTYKQAINKEVANISRIQQKQHHDSKIFPTALIWRGAS